MSRDHKPSSPPTHVVLRTGLAVELVTSGEAPEAALVNVTGLVDESFVGFGNVGTAKALVLNVAGLTRMTSFGVRQWLRAMEALPRTITDLYLLGCPTFVVDQLNMVLNFGGAGKVLTAVAPYACPTCALESGETIDMLVERANLKRGAVPEKVCSRCGSKLELDETLETYFAFVDKYAATSLHPAAAKLLAAQGLYASEVVPVTPEKPPRIIKLVHGSVTYFRIIGTMGAMFRARPILVGAEGEVVIDLAEVERFDAAAFTEWRRLLKMLAGEVPSVTIVDVTESFLAVAGASLTTARNIAVASVLVPYACVDCGRIAHDSETLLTANWPRDFEDHVCSTCGGRTQSKLPRASLVPLQKASTSAPPASAKIIAHRDELLSRAVADAQVAQAGEHAVASLSANDTILGKYKIVRPLSEGGMAEVFLANQVGIGGFEKPVALKRIQRKLLDTRQLAIELFLNEAKIAGRLTHPNIVQVLDVGQVGGALYLAMEYVHGKDLRNVIKAVQQASTTMPLGDACYIIREVAQALHHAYWSTDMNGKQLSVVHRDVSPQNVIIGYDGTVKLLDFGVAMSAVTEHAETMIVGKWLYMSPETTLNARVDHRSDLFSLGVILYLLCSGRMPFSGRDPREIVNKINAGQFRPLQEIVKVPERLAKLVSRMLASNPNDRPQRGQDVVAELNDIMQAYGLERSSSRMAEYLTSLFPYDTGPLEPDAQPRLEELRTSQPYDVLSPSSLSPIPHGELPGRRSSASISVQPYVADGAARRSSASISVPPHFVDGPSQRPSKSTSRPPPLTSEATVVLPPAGPGSAAIEVPPPPQNLRLPPGVALPPQQVRRPPAPGARLPIVVAVVLIVAAVALYIVLNPA